MATLVLQTIGSVVGGAVAGPVGATVGRLAAGLGGAAIDSALRPQASPRYTVGPRLKSMDGVASMEGAGVPRVYGRARIGGQMIWATRFLERAGASVSNAQQQSSGGKGGSGGGSSTINIRYNYFANFAIGLCEGPIAFVRRIWADGQEVDLTKLPIRIYTGDETQDPDPLIVAKEGAENAPAYRGLAYIVFEKLPLAKFGNRVPQFTFEVVKPVDGLGAMIRAVDIIPGATEAGYHPALKLNFSAPGKSAPENRHQLTAESDWVASIDALQALCPNLESVALVVAWFGDDLRAADCTLAPRVDARFKTIGAFNYLIGGYWPPDWSVAGLTRASARLVSQVDGRSAYGGTPSDASVRRAIADLKARGLKVTFYPFVMMDVPPGNALLNPYTGASGQPVFPWRGRITCSPAPGQPGSPDGAAAAATQVTAFFNRYRDFILHYAAQCVSAGGVDAFLIGSELMGLTRIRSASGVYPAVAALTALAADVKAIVGAPTKVSYAADWTEYGAHVPAPGELRFPLDPFWASGAVDFIGVDVYWPLSDWRDGDAHLDAQIAPSIYDLAYLQARVNSGEAYDWYYANATARDTQSRTPITDGLGKPWVYRQKDFVSWWSQPHFERVGGVELATPTAWTPQSKPIWIVETGCPAVDRGANAPNVFPDPRSSEGGLPHYSRDGRDDLIQARFLEAMLTHFDPAGALAETHNPTSSVYGGPMVEPARIHVWCWDARPFPAFPLLNKVWSDSANWETGHWLNGRLEGMPLDRLLLALAGAVDAPELARARPDVAGYLDGYVLDRPMSPRDAIDPLSALYGFDPIVGGGVLRFVERRGAALRDITDDDLVPGRDGALVTLTRAQESELPHEIALSYSDSEMDYRTGRVLSRRLEGWSARQSEAQAAVMTHRSNAQRLANIWLQDVWAARETAEFSLRPGLVALQPGDLVRLGAAGGGRLFQIQQIADGAARKVSARAVNASVYDAPGPREAAFAAAGTPPQIAGPARVAALDLAILRDTTALSWIAVYADPWPGPMAVWKLGATGGYEPFAVVESRATIGDTLDELPSGPVGRFDNGASIRVQFGDVELSSVGDPGALGGSAVAAIQGVDGAWEIFSFAKAELVDDGVYRLSRLVRGLGGEEHLASRTTPAGATVVLLDGALIPLARTTAEIDAPATFRVGPADRDYADPIVVQATVAATAKTLQPYAPARARARRTAQGVVIDFIRRGRIESDPFEGLEIPLGETSESYEAVVTLPAGARTLNATSPSILYPATQELADFGAPQSTLTLSIYQMSATVGRGFPLTTTLLVQ